MSDLLKTKSEEAQRLGAQATKEEKELETLNAQLAQLNQKVAILAESAREKRVYADVLEAATKQLGGFAPVVEITSGKKSTKGVKAAKVAKVAKVAAAPAAAPAAAAAPAKDAKGKAKGKPGKTAKAAEKTAAPAKTAAPKKAKTAATAAAKPRVAGDDRRPPLHERLRIVIGEDQVTIPLAIERLKARDASWLPESTDLNAYISLALSTHKETFERVTRGVYKVRKEALTATAGAKPSVKKAVTAQKTNGTHNPSNGIEDLGTNVAENPFSTAAA